MIGLFSFIKGSKIQHRRWLLILFVTIYGSMIRFAQGSDGERHFKRLENHYLDLDLEEFSDELWGILVFDPEPETNDDVYIHLVYFISGTILGWPALFFTIIAFVYGYFYIGAIMKILDCIKPRSRLSWELLGFIVIFISWEGLEGINTIRTWTGGWILIYAILGYGTSKKTKYLLLMFLPPFIHIGYFILGLPAWLVIFFGNYPKAYLAAYFLSFVVSLNSTFIVDKISTTTLGADKVEGYYVDLEETQPSNITYQAKDKFQSSRFYTAWFQKGVQFYGIHFLVIIILILLGFSQSGHDLYSKLFSIGLLYKAMSNVTGFLYAVANRSEALYGLFILAAFILIYFYKVELRRSKNLLMARLLTKLSLLIFIPLMIYKTSNLLSYSSVFILALPIIPWIENSANLSIREFVSWLL